MTEIEKQALALLNEVQDERLRISFTHIARDASACEALCRAIEQHEAFRQEVSDVVGDTLFMVETHCDGEAVALVSNRLLQFILPAPKPDPLVEIISEIEDGTYGETKAEYAAKLRAALEARGLTITTVEKD